MVRISMRDEEALLEIYDRYSSLSLGIIVAVIHDEGIAEEIMQDIFLMLWRRPEVYDPGRGALGAWITVVSRHRAIDALRRRRPEITLEGVEVSTNGHQEANTSLAETILHVRRVLSCLPVEHREAFELAYFEGMSHTEISAHTGTPLGTIKSRLRLALATLRKVMLDQAA